MDTQISKRDIIHGKYLECLRGKQSRLFPELDLQRILYNECYYCLESSVIKLVLRVFKCFLFKPSELKVNTKGCSILTFYTKNYRNDHDTYWEQILKDVGDHDEITILSKGNLIRRIDFRNIFKKLYWFLTAYFDLKVIEKRKDRLYLTLQLVARKYTFERVKELNLHPRIVMCFFDSSPDENIIMQYFKAMGCKTITNQHGQPVFQSNKYDRVNQSQILNFKTDYFLAKGQFVRQQFVSAGLDDSRVKLVGMIGTGFDIIDDIQTDVFGVFLDAPILPFSHNSNNQIIKVANTISHELGMRYLLKVHPLDQKEKYVDIVGECCIDILGRETKIDSVLGQIEFAIIHASATYIDVYCHGIRCFKIETDVYYPIAFETDCFTTVQELEKKIHEWKELSPQQRREYIRSVKDYYDIGWHTGNIKKTLEEIDCLV